MKFVYVFLLVVNSLITYAQGFIIEAEEGGISYLLGNPCLIEFSNGDRTEAILNSASFVNGYISAITIKNESGEKIKLKPEEINRLSVKVLKAAKITMMAESVNSIKEMTKTDFNDVMKRDTLIFETARHYNKNGKPRLMQLLNPGFDSKIKVYADPNPDRKTNGLALGTIQVTGGLEKSYLFVQNNQKAILVKKGSYKKNFEELYGNCRQMLMAFGDEKIKWQDVAGHVYAFNFMCQE
jgi:hypothetical protein